MKLSALHPRYEWSHADEAKAYILPVLRDLAADLAELGGPQRLQARLDLLAATFACHHSVRAGRVLSVAAALEARSEHPLAAAILAATEGRGQIGEVARA